MAITITEYRNVESWNDANTRFDMEINHPLHGWIPFTLDMSDDGTDIDKDALRTLIGTNFTAMSQEKIDRIEGDAVRHQRDTILLYEVDPIIANSLRWAELTTENRTNGNSTEQIYLMCHNNQVFHIMSHFQQNHRKYL